MLPYGFLQGYYLKKYYALKPNLWGLESSKKKMYTKSAKDINREITAYWKINAYGSCMIKTKKVTLCQVEEIQSRNNILYPY